jgi:hypothetical protein
MYPITKTIRAEKRDAASERQRRYNNKTLEQKLASAQGRKQRAKLEAQIAAASKKGAASEDALLQGQEREAAGSKQLLPQAGKDHQVQH